MQKKDMSEIVEILRTNGVGFLNCFFRSSQSLVIDDEDEEALDTSKEWFIDFSDGKNYLGSVSLPADHEVDDIVTTLSAFKEGRNFIESFSIYEAVDNHEICVNIMFSTITELFGTCTIYCY